MILNVIDTVRTSAFEWQDLESKQYRASLCPYKSIKVSGGSFIESFASISRKSRAHYLQELLADCSHKFGASTELPITAIVEIGGRIDGVSAHVHGMFPVSMRTYLRMSRAEDNRRTFGTCEQQEQQVPRQRILDSSIPHFPNNVPTHWITVLEDHNGIDSLSSTSLGSLIGTFQKLD